MDNRHDAPRSFCTSPLPSARRHNQPSDVRASCIVCAPTPFHHSKPQPFLSTPGHTHAQVAGIVAGVLIYWGGKKTRRTEQVEDRLRTALEMEHEQKRAANGDTGSTTVEEAAEAPERMPGAPQTSEKPDGSGTRVVYDDPASVIAVPGNEGDNVNEELKSVAEGLSEKLESLVQKIVVV